MYEGEELARDKAADSLRESIGQRLNDSTLHKVVRNAASTWTQSGHLCGRVHKFRQTVEPTPSVTAYALLLGYLLGLRGGNLFTSVWARVLDRPRETLVALAVDARGLGLLDISYAGGIIPSAANTIVITRTGGRPSPQPGHTVELELPVVYVLMNNRAYALEQHAAQAGGLRPVGVQLSDIRYDQAAAAMGGAGFRINVNELPAVLSELKDSRRPTVIDVQVEAVPIPTAHL